jgi:hypothetical protein
MKSRSKRFRLVAWKIELYIKQYDKKGWNEEGEVGVGSYLVGCTNKTIFLISMQNKARPFSHL